VNINISRMMERSSEIGVRKAFGASAQVLVSQFVIENILITLLGGLLGLAFTIPVMQGLNFSDFIPGLQLNMNFTLFGQALLLILIFGLMSGVYPAYRMSKLEIVKALNTDQK
jgi:putative ABC transport system permease protein